MKKFDFKIFNWRGITNKIISSLQLIKLFYYNFY